MTRYYRLILGRGHMYADECFRDGYIGVGFLFDRDLTNELPDDWQAFNKTFIPIFLENNPDKSKVTAGLACGATWTVAKGIKVGDVVLCPINKDSYRIAKVAGEYFHAPGPDLPNRRRVEWLPEVIHFEDMSEALRRSVRSIGTVCDLTRDHSVEIEKFISGKEGRGVVTVNDEAVEDPSTFAMEQHLEDFLIKNWSHTLFGKTYKVYEDSDGKVGQQFLTDSGPIDILAISKDKKTLLVIELKRGRASDVVVGQTLRYMGYVQEVLAEADQKVRGIIIALEDDHKLRRALAMTPFIEFYRYEISFKLVKA